MDHLLSFGCINQTARRNSRQQRLPEAPLPFTSSKFRQVRFHLLEATHFAIIDRLVKTSAVNDLYAQGDIGTVAAHCGIAEGLLVRPDLVHGWPFFFRKYPLGYGAQRVDPRNIDEVHD